MRLSSKGRYYAFISLILTLAIGSFGYQNASASEKAHPHWAYEGEGGPADWGHISKEYKACSEGKNQSPIDIKGAKEEDLSDISVNYKPSKLDIINNGHTVQVNYDKGSVATIDGVEYDLVQFHFHAPSEHTVDGKPFPIENHLVHKNAKGELAVIGVLIEEGAENPAYSDVMKNLPAKADSKKTVDVEVDAGALLPKDMTFFRYSGSLTTPPCSEGVKWSVLKTPVQLSKAQIDAFKSIFKMNARPIQPVNEREVKADTKSK